MSGVDEHPLRCLLSRYPSAIRPRRPPESLGNHGGLSGSRLWRFEAARGRFVARAWPPDGPSAESLARIHGWLSEARSLGFVAVPEADLSGRTVQQHSGRLWDVSPWMPGSADPARPPSEARLRAGVAALAAFHQALARHATTGTSPGLRARLEELAGLISGGFDRLAPAVDRAAPGPEREAALAWLPLARRLAPGLIDPLRRAASRVVPLQPCLRDARPEHLLFEGDRVAGLIDYGAMGVESVSADLARLLSGWLGDDPATIAPALEAYGKVRPLGDAELALLGPFRRSAALLGGARWIGWRFLQGRRFEDPSAALWGLRRSLDQLAAMAAGPGRGGYPHLLTLASHRRAP